MEDKILKLKKLLEEDLLGEIPLFFNKVSVFNKEVLQEDEAQRLRTARRVLTVDKYKSERYLLSYPKMKPVSKILNR